MARAAAGGVVDRVVEWLAASASVEGEEGRSVDVVVLTRGLLFVFYVGLSLVVLLVFT